MARPRTTTPTRPDDARAHRSMEALRDAFLELLESKSLEDITIREITDRAGLSYPTFFRRYGGKDELLADIATEEVRRLLSLGQRAMDSGASPDSADAMFTYVQNHRHLWKTLLTGGAASAMREEFMRISREIASTRPRSNPWLPIELSVPFVTSGIFEIFAWWMAQPDDYPVENVKRIFDVLIIDAFVRSRDISLT